MAHADGGMFSSDFDIGVAVTSKEDAEKYKNNSGGYYKEIMVFDKIENAMKFKYPDQYNKKRGQKYGYN